MMLAIAGKRFYSFTTACLSLLDESNRINELLREKNEQVHEPADADFIVVTTCAVSRDSAENSADNIIKLREQNPRARIFVGGCLSNAEEKDVLKGIPDILFFTADDSFRHVDLVPWTCSRSTTRCEPFWIRGMKGKRKRLNRLTSKNKRLAKLYAYITDGLLFQHMPFRFDTLRLSKGCSKQCSYCAIPNNRGMYLEHSLDYIKKQIDASDKRYLLLIGENIGCHNHLEEAIDYAIKKGKRLMLRYLEPEYARRIRERQLRYIDYIGVPIQTGSSKVIKEMRRPRNIRQVKRSFKEWRKKGIFTGTSIILSHPKENLLDYLKTIWFIASTPLHYVSFQNFSPRENSPDFERYSDWDSQRPKIRFKFWLFDKLVNLKGKINYAKERWSG